MSVLFLLAQWQYKHERWEKLEHAAAIRIEIPIHELHWVKAKKEIRINGQYFDVFSYRYTNAQTVVLTGIYDDTEHALEKQFHQQTNQESQKRSGQVTQFLQQLFFVDQQTIWRTNLSCSLISIGNNTIHSILPSIFLAVSTPPPDKMI